MEGVEGTGCCSPLERAWGDPQWPEATAPGRQRPTGGQAASGLGEPAFHHRSAGKPRPIWEGLPSREATHNMSCGPCQGLLAPSGRLARPACAPPRQSLVLVLPPGLCGEEPAPPGEQLVLGPARKAAGPRPRASTAVQPLPCGPTPEATAHCPSLEPPAQALLCPEGPPGPQPGSWEGLRPPHLDCAPALAQHRWYARCVGRAAGWVPRPPTRGGSGPSPRLLCSRRSRWKTGVTPVEE